MTRRELDLLLRQALLYGSLTDKRAYVSPSVAESIKSMGDSAWSNEAPLRPNPNEDGADLFLQGAYGFRVPVFIKDDFPSGIIIICDGPRA